MRIWPFKKKKEPVLATVRDYDYETMDRARKKIKRKVCEYCGTPWGRSIGELSCKKCGAPLPDEAMDDQTDRFEFTKATYVNPLSFSYGKPRYTVACTSAEEFVWCSTSEYDSARVAEIEEMGDG